MTIRENALLKRAQAYYEQAIGELYDHYAPLIYSYLYRRVHDAKVAEDLTGDVFVRVLQAIQSERFWQTSFRAWLYRIAHNRVIDYYREQSRMIELSLEEHLETEDETSDEMDATHADRQTFQTLAGALDRLTPDQQQVLVLRFGEQMKVHEVAEMMDKSIGAIEALQHRALAALRRMIEQGKET